MISGDFFTVSFFIRIFPRTIIYHHRQYITQPVKTMLDYRVILEAAWIVKDVTSVPDAIGIAVSEAGKRLQPSAKFVDVDILTTPCPYCEREIDTGMVVARTGFVGLLLSMKVFSAENPEHAERIAKTVIGKALRDIPLSTYSIEQLDSEEAHE